MKWVFLIIAAILVLAALLIPLYLLLFGSITDLVRVRDTAIIYSALFMCVGAILFILLTGILAYISFTIREYIVPALQKVDDTVKTVRGTTTFVSESVVSPIVKIAGAAAGTRAMVQTLMRRNPPKLEGAKKEDESK
jgi:hypothetical protein